MPSFLPERIAIGVLAAAVGWLVYRDIVAERQYQLDRTEWLAAQADYWSQR